MVHPNSVTKQFSDFFAQINKDQLNHLVILTPNKRLARFIREQHSQIASAQGRKHGVAAWPSLACHSYQGWVQQQWDNLQIKGEHPATTKVLLEATHELILWQSVITNHQQTPALINTNATAKLAMQAWRLCQEWHLDLNADNELNSRIFRGWCEAFQQSCAESQLITQVEIVAALIDGLLEQMLTPPKQLILYGFDDLSLLQQELLSALKDQGTSIDTWQLEPTENHDQVNRYAFTDLQQEIEASALWAKQQNERHPDAKIAIVVPQLAQQREHIERTYQQIFEPQYIYPHQAQHAPGINISAGQPLDKVPIVSIALAILQCDQRWLEVELVSQLLRSPFLGSAEEINERALLDIELRGHDFQISFQQIKTSAGAKVSEEGEDYRRRCPDLYDRLDRFHHLARQCTQSRYPSEWAKVFCEQLSTMGWPGPRPLDTLEYQQLQSWQQALHDYSGLDMITGVVDSATAQRQLRTLLSQVSFQAQTKSSPIQILGLLEAAGLPFDYLWIMNLDDETWPPAPNPNPLLPIHLQIEKNLPQSSAQRELAYAQRLTSRLIGGAEHVVFSHAQYNGDKEVSASPLIASAKLLPFTLTTSGSIADDLFTSQEMEASLDNCGPKVLHPDSIRGGSQLLKDQSACPFRAFAKFRLHSQEIPTTTIGLDQSERGNLVHRVLEIIWRRIKHQNKLLQLEDTELNSIIQQAIENAFIQIKNKRFIGNRFLALESNRLSQQIRDWMEIEKQRAPFSVLFNEGRRTLKIGKLPLHIRYDRVDKLADGSLFVLDYKTGKQEIRYWAGERPDEPQVPLYCIANQKKVSAAGFGQITADETAIKGIGESEDVAPGIKTPDMVEKLELPKEWPDILDHWRVVLERLAHEFMAGAAQVDPKNPNVTCRFCDLKSLCRIKERFDLNSDDDGNGDHELTFHKAASADYDD